MDRTIAAGETDTVEITIAGTRISTTTITKSVLVRTNDRAQPQTNLMLNVKINSAIKLEPVAVNFGSIKRDDEARTQVVKLLRADAGPISPKLKSTGNKNVKAELTEIKAGEEYELKTTIEPPWPSGSIAANISFETGVERSPVETISVMAHLPPRVSANPSVLLFEANSEEEQKLSFELVWNGPNPGHVTSGTINSDAVKVDVGEAAAPQKVAVTLPAHFNQEVGKPLRVNLQLDDDVAPAISVPLISKQAADAKNRTPRGKGGDPTR